MPYIDPTIEPTLYPAIEQLVNRIGGVTEEQITKYFRVHHKDTVLWCLSRLVHNPRINYDETKKLYVPRAPQLQKPAVAEAVKKAAWVLAEFGDTNVLDYIQMGYPQSLLIVTTDNKAYDVTVVNAANAGVIRSVNRIYRQQNTPNTDAEDAINHIALVTSETVAAEVRNAGFDCYCILDRTHTPQYHTF